MNDTKINLITAQLRLQHPDWSFERVFTEAVEQSGQTGSFGHDSVDKGTKLIALAEDSRPAIKSSSPPAPAVKTAQTVAKGKPMLVKGSDWGWCFDIHTGKQAGGNG
jgi:hypothetical protein